MISIDIQFKETLHQYCLNSTREKIKRLNDLLKSNLIDLNSATKSTAGDKHETARAMIHIEQDNHSRQLLEAQKIMNLLTQINTKPRSFAQAGALVKTNMGLFYMATGLGKVLINKNEVYVISPGSPIGQKLLGSAPKDTVIFNKSNYYIEQVI